MGEAEDARDRRGVSAGLDPGDGALGGACPLREGPLGDAGEFSEGEDEIPDADRVSVFSLPVDRRPGSERQRRLGLVPNPILGS